MNKSIFSFVIVCVIFLISSCQLSPKIIDSTDSSALLIETSSQKNLCDHEPTAERQPAAANQCINLFKNDSGLTKPGIVNSSQLTETELLNFTSQKVMSVEEFKFIRDEAKKMGVRVWMFGGTASSFLHYAKWDLYRKKGQFNLQADRFDYDFTNIFRSTQDLDIVLDGTVNQIQTFQEILSKRFPYFLGSKKAWEVRSLRFQMGRPGEGYFKEALLNDPNFSEQNTDTNSLAMVEISESNDPVVRDLRSWNNPANQLFLTDAINNTISFLRSPKHFQTARAKMGENPEILSVLRLLVKAFQYDLSIDPNSMKDIQKVITDFNPTTIINQNALRRINETAAKLVIHSNNIENAIDILDQLGLRQKLKSMNLSDYGNESAKYWLQKEPLRSFNIPGSNFNPTQVDKPKVEVQNQVQSDGQQKKTLFNKIIDYFKENEVTKEASHFENQTNQLKKLPNYTSGQLKNHNFHPTGKTAKDLGITLVAHETNNMLAYESITKSHSGEPNVLISRANIQGESASLGDGFYTAIGKVGARGTGLTIRFTVDPNAREGVDFTASGSYVIWYNKKSLKVIQESLNLGIEQVIDLVMSNENFNLDHTDLGIAEKMKRRLNASKILSELERLMNSPKAEDHQKFEDIFSALLSNNKFSKIISQDVISTVIKFMYSKISELKNSKNENDQIKYITQISLMIEKLELANLTSKKDFEEHLRKILQDKSKSVEVRKTALKEWFAVSKNFDDIDKLFSKEELLQIKSEVSTWQNIKNNERKKKIGSLITTYIEFLQFYNSIFEIDNSTRLNIMLESGSSWVDLKFISIEKIREEIKKIQLTPEIINNIFHLTQTEKKISITNFQFVFREILNVNPKAARYLSLDQLVFVLKTIGSDPLIKGLRPGDRLGLHALAKSLNINIPETLYISYESLKSTEFVIELMGLVLKNSAQAHSILFIDNLTEVPWLTPGDKMLLELALAWDRYITSMPGLRGDRKLLGVGAYEKEIVRIHHGMAQQSTEWQRIIYERFFLPNAKAPVDRKEKLIRFPYFLIQFVEFADLPYFLKALESLTPAEITKFGSTYQNFKIDKFSSKQVYDTFFNNPKFAKIQRTILEFFPDILRLLTVDDVRQTSANLDWYNITLAKRLFEIYESHPEHPVLQEAISRLDAEEQLDVKGLMVQKNVSLELWFQFMLSYEGKVTGNSKSGPGQELLVFETTFSRVNGKIFQAYLEKNKMTPKNFYDHVILKKLNQNELTNDEFKVIVWLLHLRRTLDFPVDKQAAGLFWKHYNRATDLQYLDRYTHPVNVGHNLPTH